MSQQTGKPVMMVLVKRMVQMKSVAQKIHAVMMDHVAQLAKNAVKKLA